MDKQNKQPNHTNIFFYGTIYDLLCVISPKIEEAYHTRQHSHALNRISR